MARSVGGVDDLDALRVDRYGAGDAVVLLALACVVAEEAAFSADARSGEGTHVHIWLAVLAQQEGTVSR